MIIEEVNKLALDGDHVSQSNFPGRHNDGNKEEQDAYKSHLQKICDPNGLRSVIRLSREFSTQNIFKRLLTNFSVTCLKDLERTNLLTNIFAVLIGSIKSSFKEDQILKSGDLLTLEMITSLSLFCETASMIKDLLGFIKDIAQQVLTRKDPNDIKSKFAIQTILLVLYCVFLYDYMKELSKVKVKEEKLIKSLIKETLDIYRSDKFCVWNGLETLIFLHSRYEGNDFEEPISEIIASIYPWKDGMLEKIREMEFVKKRQNLNILFGDFLTFDQLAHYFTNLRSRNEGTLTEGYQVDIENLILKLLLKAPDYTIVDMMQKNNVSLNIIWRSLINSLKYSLEEKYVSTFDYYIEALVKQRRDVFKNPHPMNSEPKRNKIRSLENTGLLLPKEYLLEILKPSIKNLSCNHTQRLVAVYTILEFYNKFYYPVSKINEDSYYTLETLYNFPIQINFLSFKETFNSSKGSPVGGNIYERIKKNLISLWPVMLLPTNLLSLDVSDPFKSLDLFKTVSDFIIDTEIFSEDLDLQLTYLNMSFIKKCFVALKPKEFLKIWKVLFCFDFNKASNITVKIFVEESLAGLSLYFKNTNHVDPSHFLLIKKVYLMNPFFLEIILNSMTVVLKNWENQLPILSQSKPEEIQDYLLTLKSSLVQYLLECVEPSPKEAQPHEYIICHYIHELCIEDIQLIQAIIFQGFDKSIIRKAVNHIEWMHCIIDFGETILDRKDQNYNEFSWELLSHTIEKYPMQRSMELSLFFFEMIDSRLEAFFKASDFKILINCLERIQRAFPQLEERILNLKKRIKLRVNEEACLFDKTWLNIKHILASI